MLHPYLDIESRLQNAIPTRHEIPAAKFLSGFDPTLDFGFLRVDKIWGRPGFPHSSLCKTDLQNLNSESKTNLAFVGTDVAIRERSRDSREREVESERERDVMSQGAVSPPLRKLTTYF